LRLIHKYKVMRRHRKEIEKPERGEAPFKPEVKKHGGSGNPESVGGSRQGNIGHAPKPDGEEAHR
jgi:hypothetical protein